MVALLIVNITEYYIFILGPIIITIFVLSRLSLPGIYIFRSVTLHAHARSCGGPLIRVFFYFLYRVFFPIRENVTAVSHCATFRNDFLVADIALCLLVTRAQGRLKQQTHLFIEGATVCVA